MTCNCVKEFRTSAVTLTGGNLYLTIPGIQFNTLPNYTKLKIDLCQTIPADADTAPVFLSDGIVNVPALNSSGNTLRADEIRCRNRYCFVYGTDDQHVLLRDRTCRSAFNPATPTVAAGTPAVATTEAVATQSVSVAKAAKN